MTAARPPAGILAVAGLFVIAVIYLIVASLTPKRVSTFAPDPATGARAEGHPVDTLTVDARADRTWRFLDLNRRTVVDPPDTAGWDLAFQRHTVIAARGILDLGKGSLDTVRAVPATGYVANVTRSDTTNPAIGRWYSYSLLSHLLEPSGHVYATPLDNGRHAVFEIVSYYCPGPEAGCVTLRVGFR